MEFMSEEKEAWVLGATVGQTSNVGMTGAEVVANDGTDVEGGRGLVGGEGVVDEGIVEETVEGSLSSRDMISTDV